MVSDCNTSCPSLRNGQGVTLLFVVPLLLHCHHTVVTLWSHLLSVCQSAVFESDGHGVMMNSIAPESTNTHAHQKIAHTNTHAHQKIAQLGIEPMTTHALHLLSICQSAVFQGDLKLPQAPGLQECDNSDTTVSQQCYNSVRTVSEQCYNSVTTVS
jgi:hypothetical protein